MEILTVPCWILTRIQDDISSDWTVCIQESVPAVYDYKYFLMIPNTSLWDYPFSLGRK